MTESTLKGELMALFRLQRPKGITFRIESNVGNGVPDIVDTCNYKTTWLEVKFVNPRLRCSKLQVFTALELARHGHCWFVLYVSPPPTQKRGFTLILHPRDIERERWKNGETGEGFDHQFVVDFVRKNQFIPRRLST